MQTAVERASIIASEVFTSPFFGLGIIELGAPCSGKGTQAKVLAKTFGITHISSGAILVGNKKAKPFMDAGKPVPDEYLFPAIELELTNYPPGEIKGLIEDGWVRDVGQIDKAMHLGRGVGIKRFVALEYTGIPTDELIRRMVERAILQGRTDDKPEVFEERIQIYNENRPLIVAGLEAVGCPVGIVHGYDHPDTVFMNTIITLRGIL